jgi:hypothetical protein
MKLGDLFIKLGLKSSEFDRGINKAKSGTSSLMGVVKKLGGVMAAAFSIRAMVNFFTTSVKLANEQIAVENELASALRSNGKDVDINMRRYKRFASQMQSMTTIGDETTLSLIRLAETMQSKAPEEAARMAIGLSKALKMDLQTATRAAVLAQNGNTTALQRQIPALREATTEAGRLAAIQKTVTVGMRIAADEANTVAGKWAQVKNAWGDVREEIGNVIANNDDLVISLEKLKTEIELLPDYAKLAQRSFSWIFGSTVKRSIREAEKEFDEFVNTVVSGIDNINDTDDRPIIEKIKTIADLRSEIKAWKDEQEALAITEKAASLAISQRIKKNEELIRSLTELIEVSKDVRAENRAVGAIAPAIQFTGKLTAREGQFGRNSGAFMRDMPAIDTKQLADMTSYMDRMREAAAQMQYDMLEDWRNFNQNLGYLIEDFAIDIVDNFGAAMGELLATGEFPSDFGKNILSSIGRFISTLGKMLIALGVGSEAFKQLLGSGFLSGGIGAIAAGAALVAIGGGISSYARSRASGGSSGGVGPAMYNQQFNFAGQATKPAQDRIYLKGDTLWIAQQRNEFKRAAIG